MPLRRFKYEDVVSRNERHDSSGFTDPEKDLADSLHLIEELRQFQFELQQQNEELRRTYAELSRATHRYRELWQNSPVGYVTFQRSGIINEVNDRALSILHKEYMTPGATLQSCFTPDSTRVFQQHLWGVIGSGHTEVTELEVRSQTRPRWILMETAIDEVGEFRASFIDITRQRLTEQENRRLAEEMQQSQRLNTLQNLSGGIAHDFNNILQIILAYGEVLDKPEVEKATTEECVREIIQAAKRGSELTKRLLAFSRRATMNKKSINLHSLLDHVASLMTRTLAENIIVSRIRSEESALMVSVDDTLMEQAIINMCLNARDAMPEGGRLTLETSSETVSAPRAKSLRLEAGLYATFRIVDTGCGMTRDVASHAFEPFFTTKGQGQGTGMGLALVHGIVSQHGGAVTVQSEPGNGTQFQVFLPFDVGPTPVPRRKPRKKNGSPNRSRVAR